MNPEWSPITDPRSTWCCKSARLRGIFFCFFYWADKFVRKGLGKVNCYQLLTFYNSVTLPDLSVCCLRIGLIRIFDGTWCCAAIRIFMDAISVNYYSSSTGVLFSHQYYLSLP